MDPRDASSVHNQRQPQPHGVTMPPQQFAFGHHFPNNVFMMAPPNSGPNLIQNPNFGFNSLTPIGSGHASFTHYQQNQQPTQPQLQQQQQRNGSPAQGVTAASPITTVGSEQIKKKRGRPRKHLPSPDDITLGFASNSPAVSMAVSGVGGQKEAGEGNAEEGLKEKRPRGRPRGSVKKQLDAIGAASAARGAEFTTHVLVVPAGENIVAKLVELSQEGPQTICVLSANGTVHNVTLRQVTGGTLYHEGQHEIVSMSGSFCRVNNDGSQNNTLNLTVTLAGADGRLIGGGVTRELIAASSIQMVACSFIGDKKHLHTSPVPNQTSHMLSFGGSAAPNNASQHDATSDPSDDDDSSDGQGHPQNLNPGFYNYGQQWSGGTTGWA